MFESLKIFHSYWAALTLLILVLATFNAIIKLVNKRNYIANDLKISRFSVLTIHLQLLLGITLLIIGYVDVIQSVGMAEVMKNATLRNNIIEHPLLMVLATVLVTIGFSKHKKKNTPDGRFKTIAIFYGLALILVLVKIPWSTWSLFQ